MKGIMDDGFIKLKTQNGSYLWVRVSNIAAIDFDITKNYGDISIWMIDGRNAFKFPKNGFNNAAIGLLLYGKYGRENNEHEHAE